MPATKLNLQGIANSLIGRINPAAAPTAAPAAAPAVAPAAAPTAARAPVQTLAEQQRDYDQLVGQYNALDQDYQTGLRNLDYSKRAYDRSGSLWGQLEQQRMSGGGYGANRFYANGEIYNFDPNAGTYRGSISGQLFAQPTEYQAPVLPQNPGTMDEYLSGNPYFEYLQQQANSASSSAPVKSTRPSEPYVRPGQSGHIKYTWSGDRWIKQGDLGGGPGN